MSLKHIDWVWNNRENLQLSGPDTSTLVKLAALSDDEANPVHESIATLARNLGYCERTVRRSIHSLVHKKLILKIYDPEFQYFLPKPYRSNAYQINVAVFSSLE